ncbi:hypothetical protein CK203_104263 [Vitis vinifera]|uniref:Uncharacterized protein n=1 Tax=Vitis vinifera TaxID=29760 RepID=A0A438C5V4_VITVI|nr:hypothetical protein CK203_104263 [Vitis vinifera]
MVTETYGIPSMRMDSEMTSIEASLCLTSLWKELDNINNQTPLWYMAAFFSIGAQRHSGVSSDVVGHSGYALVDNPTHEDHAFPSEKDMPWHGVDHVLDTPDCNVALDFELQPNGRIHVQSDGEEENEPDVMSLSVFIIPSRNRSVRRCRVRQMAPNLLSPFISQLETRQSAIRMNLKEAVAFVFSRDLDAR